MEDASIKLGVMVFPPRAASAGLPARAHFIYATNGMSERRMPCRVEPHGRPDWRVELLAYTSVEAPWVAELLIEMARYPFIHGSGFAIGHTLPVQAGAQNLWHGYLLTKPRLEPATINPLVIDIGIGPDWVFHVQVFGLVGAELEEAIKIGDPAFAERYLPTTLPRETSFLDLRRKSVMLEGGS